MNFHHEYRIPYLDKIMFLSKNDKELVFGFGKTALIMGRWFAYIERP